MLFFQNDYGQGCIPEIMDILVRTRENSYKGYESDEQSNLARQLIQAQMPSRKADIWFIMGGTLANLTMIRSVLRSYEAVIACNTGHINVHEAGSIEATGHKVIPVPHVNGKVTADAVRKVYAESMLQFGHMAFPKMVYISNATEFGTVYTREEFESLRTVCDELGLYLMMDGARLGAALESGVDYTLDDIAKWCDLFYIGGTKNGALLGEAVCIVNEDLKKNFIFVMKQSGALAAKGWVLGQQFIGLFQDGAFYRVAKQEVELAQEIQTIANELKYPLYIKSSTNQIFISVTEEEYLYLKENIAFEIWEKTDCGYVIRFVTSWHTTQKEIDQLTIYLKQAKALAEEKAD
ncbi:MAG: aminotransferase class I/II-fold pyridoxal phosphate-dependent enzyme [Firmicutes bacterium]|nr:aminotransferase class I/II-fold pyridoxal phosphate-dependent enzyme [Bacillota bacterium]